MIVKNLNKNKGKYIYHLPFKTPLYIYIYIYIKERWNYTGVTSITITIRPFYDFQLNNIILKITNGLKVSFT